MPLVIVYIKPIAMEAIPVFNTRMFKKINSVENSNFFKNIFSDTNN